MPKAKLGWYGAQSLIDNWTQIDRVIRPRDFTQAKWPHA
jgi:hypothetical protein